jgi:hypothetical protein
VQGWSEIQAKHYRRIGSMRSAKQWLAKIIRQLWEISWSMWKLRNKVLHQEQKGLQKVQLQVEIAEQFQRGFAGFSSKVEYLTKLSQDDVLARTTSFQKLWLRRIKIYRAERDRQSTAVLERRLRDAAIRRLRKRRSDGTPVPQATDSDHSNPQSST